MKPTSILLLTGLLSFAVVAMATEAENPAWRAFQHALGQPAWIGANADHPDADAAWRPLTVPQWHRFDEQRFRLGSDLFHDGRLSSGNSIACVTCHAGALSGADRRQVSLGVDGARGTKNALSVFNAAFNFRQFWDGRAVTLEDQALEPIQNEVEMANTLDAVLATLESDERYPARFAAVYPDGVSIGNMADAIAHFQRHSFLRLDTPFQRFLGGEEEALNESARRGLRRFEELGCVACHNGINLGGNSYQKTGEVIPYYRGERQADEDDAGLADRTGREEDRHVFKVPGLHGVADTAPYFHDGTVADLEQAIRRMGEHQLGRSLRDQDVEDLDAFLRSLGGRISRQDPVQRYAGRDSSRQGGATESSHEDAWRQALERVGQAWKRLRDEADRVRDGEVEHYDFLQFQHREMIRHARALAHTPSDWPDGLRGTLATEAQHLLVAVNALETVISDILRAQAQLRVLDAAEAEPAGLLPELAGTVNERRREWNRKAGAAWQELTDADPVARLQRLREQSRNIADP